VILQRDDTISAADAEERFTERSWEFAAPAGFRAGQPSVGLFRADRPL